jgi:phospholipid-binding lipoprotein MlaA
MLFRKSHILLLLFVLFTGCVNGKNIIKSSIDTQKVTTNDDEIDEFSDEFSEEIQEPRNDPFKQYNIIMTNFNDTFYTNIFKPVATGYANIIPLEARKSVKNFFHNILFPLRFINNLLQIKIKNVGEETSRFIINSTIGFFGFFDVAKNKFNIQPHNEDFGQTLGYWGVKSGYPIVLPFFGPSNMRDMFSKYPDIYLNPINYYINDNAGILLPIYKNINNNSLTLGEYETLKKDAIKLYPFLQNIYEQYRTKLIKE